MLIEPAINTVVIEFTSKLALRRKFSLPSGIYAEQRRPRPSIKQIIYNQNIPASIGGDFSVIRNNPLSPETKGRAFVAMREIQTNNGKILVRGGFTDASAKTGISYRRDLQGKILFPTVDGD
jgi:hypothetical protein